MNKNIKRIFFVLAVITLICTITTSCAADDMDIQNTDDILSVAEDVAVADNNAVVDTKNVEKNKNVKTETNTVEVNNYSELTTAINAAVNDEENDDCIINLNDGTYQITSNVVLNAGNKTPDITINANNNTLSGSTVARYVRFNNGCNIIINDAQISHRLQVYSNLTLNDVSLNNTLTIYAGASVTLKNSSIYTTITNNGQLIINDDVTFDSPFTLSGSGDVIINSSNVLYPYINTFYGNHTLGNITIDKEITNNGILNLNNVTIDSNVTNNGKLVISDDSIFGENCIIKGDGEIEISDADRIAPYLLIYNGTYTLNNATISTDRTNYGNLTLVNSLINGIITNKGNLTLINTTINNDLINKGSLNIDEDSLFGEEGQIIGSGEIITDDIVRLLPVISVINGNHTLNNATLDKDYVFIGNNTLNNCNINSESNINFGALYLNNITSAANSTFLENCGVVIVDDDSTAQKINNFSEVYMDSLPDDYILNQSYYVLNNQTVNFIFDDDNGLSSMIKSGDTIDVQGTISIHRSLTINKAINMTSTTRDANISLNTVSGDLSGANLGYKFSITNAGSYSNISNIYFYNTQFYVTNAHYVTLNNMSMVVNGSRVGGGVGQTTIRDNSTHVTLNNSFIYTKDNGGSSSFVITYSSYSTIENTVVQGVGNVGNILYLNTFNPTITTPEGNCFNTIRNITLIGPEKPSGIAWGIAVNGHDNLFENNKVYYKGVGMTQAYGGTAYNNTFIGNEYHDGCGFNGIPTSTLINNTAYDNGLMTVAANSFAYNNTASRMTVSGANVEVGHNNVTTLTVSGANAIVENNTVSSISVTGANPTINNNTITSGTINANNVLSFSENTIGSITASRSMNITNNTIRDLSVTGVNSNITNNNITGTLTMSTASNAVENNLNNITVRSSNVNITNNNITGTISSSQNNITIENNVINTTNDNTIVLTGNDNTVRNNELYALVKAGDNSMIVTNTTIVENNTPESGKTFIITDETYSNYFDENGILNNSEVTTYATIVLNGVFYNKSFTINNIKAEIIGNECIINNGYIKSADGALLLIENITFNNTDNGTEHIINLISDSNVVRNVNIYRNSTEGKSQEIYITGNKNHVYNNNIIITAPSVPIDYSSNPSIAQVSAMAILSNDNLIETNNIEVMATSNNTYGTCNVIDIASIQNANNNTITKNTIKMTGDNYLYAINMGINTNNNTISSNTISMQSSNYAAGIQIGNNPSNNNQITNNNININSLNTAYGILISAYQDASLSNNSISSNTINITSNQIVCIEAYNSNLESKIENTIISNNKLYADGNYTIAIATVGKSTDINNNIINIKGTTNTTAQSYDMIKPTTSGIIIQNSIDAHITDNTIDTTNGPDIILNDTTNSIIKSDINNLTTASNSDNTNIILYNSNNNTITGLRLYTTSTYTIELINSSNNIITGNNLNASYLKGGNDAVTKDENSMDNNITDNIPTLDVLTEQTYPILFDEEGVYRGSSEILSLGSDISNKDLIFENLSNKLTITNVNNYTLYNATIILTGNQTNNIEINTINFNNTDKPIYDNKIESTTKENIKFTNCNITLTGHEIIAFNSSLDESNIALELNNNNIELNGDTATVVYYNGYNKAQDIYVNYNNITVKATQTAYVINSTKSNLQFNHNIVNITGTNVTIVDIYNVTLNSHAMDYNTIEGSADSIMFLNYYKNDSTSSMIDYNNIKLSSPNPVVAINITGGTYPYIERNTIIVDATNGEIPVVTFVGTRNFGYINYNYIQARDIAGNDAILTAATKRSNTPTTTGFFSQLTAQVAEYGMRSEETIINATAQDIFNDTIEGTITITVDGEEICSTNDNPLSYTYIPTSIGTKTVIIKYSDPTGKYNTTTQTKTIKISKTKTIEMDNITGYTNTPTTITANITDEEGNPINEGNVIFADINGNILGKSSITDGLASINVTYKKELNTQITATYINPESEINNQQITSTLLITQPQTILTIDEVNITAGQNVTLTARLTDGLENNINGGKVVFKINGQTLKDENGKIIYAQVVNGTAQIEYLIPETWAGKSLNITAVYSGTSKYASTRNDTLVEVENKTATLLITPITDDVEIGSTINITAKVSLGDMPITTGKIVFKLNGKTLKDENGKIIYASVNSDGIASIEYTIPTNTKARQYTLTATFTANNYEKVEAQTDINIVKA